MKTNLIQKKLNNTFYFQQGNNPKLLLLSGTHGDEYEVIDLVNELINKNQDLLPDFIFIPKVSPSAVKLKTRKNQLGNDTNRKFYNHTDDPEAKTVMEIVSNYNFDLGVSFHEDWERHSFYMYDSAKMNYYTLSRFKIALKEIGVRLYSGIDDTSDVTLGNAIKRGYFVIPGSSKRVIHGDFWDWSLTNGFVKRLLYPEIPGKASVQTKKQLVEIIFNYLIFPILK